MNSDCQLVLDVWEVFRDILPASKRLDYATQLLDAFVEYGMEDSDLAAIVDEDPILSVAYEGVFEIEIETYSEDGYDG